MQANLCINSAWQHSKCCTLPLRAFGAFPVMGFWRSYPNTKNYTAQRTRQKQAVYETSFWLGNGDNSSYRVFWGLFGHSIVELKVGLYCWAGVLGLLCSWQWNSPFPCCSTPVLQSKVAISKLPAGSSPWSVPAHWLNLGVVSHKDGYPWSKPVPGTVAPSSQGGCLSSGTFSKHSLALLWAVTALRVLTPLLSSASAAFVLNCLCHTLADS